MDARSLNDSLEQYYESVWASLVKRLPKAKGLELPQLISANPDYAHAPIRLMVVGPHTARWTTIEGKKLFQVTVSDLMDLHRRYHNAEFDLEAAKTGFWRRSYMLQEFINRGTDRYGFISNSLVKVAQNAGQPTEEIADAISDIPLLDHEIELAQPDAVVFFLANDPYYNRILTKTFPGVTTEAVPGFRADALTRLSHPGLPSRTFRSFLSQGMGKRAEDAVEAIATMIVHP